MPTVVVPASLRDLTAGSGTVQADGATLRAVIADLERQFPAIAGRVVDGGGMRPEVFVAVDGVEAFGLDMPVAENAEVHILPAIAGGASHPAPIPPDCQPRRSA